MKMKPGPPSKFNQQLADQICDLMVDGNDLVEVCDILKLNRRTVYRWLNEYPEFDAQCARARETLTEVRLKQVRDKVVTAQAKGIDPNLLKIEVNFEQWIAERIAPRYSQRTKTEVSCRTANQFRSKRSTCLTCRTKSWKFLTSP
jgi:hypothetical protein